MYKLIFAVFGVLMFVIGTNAHAFGDNSSRASSSSRSTAVAGASAHQAQAAIAGASQQGNTTSVNDNSRYDAYDRDITPAVSAPGLVAGATTCLGSSSAGVSVPGFGVSGGSTVIDKGCQAINGSIRFAQLGMDAAAVQVMCNVPVYRKTLMETGYDCKKPEEQSIPDAPSTVFTSNASVGSGFMQ